ncbi:MAG: hypothetical protein AB7P02_17460 [Alphaproteobacteria bacterium]
MRYDVVIYFQALDTHPLHRAQRPEDTAVTPQRMLAMAGACIAARAPGARPVLITGGGLAVPPGFRVEPRKLADPALLQLDRIRAYRDYLAARVGKAGAGNDGIGAIFLDLDTLVLRELAPLFDQPFDVALTYLEAALDPPPAALDRWGLPDDGRPGAINFGVVAARFTPAAVDFFDAVLERFSAMAESGARFMTGKRNMFRTAAGLSRISDLRTWGGDQFAVISLVSAALFGTRRDRAAVAGADILLLPAAQWNWTPSDRLRRADLGGRFIAHLKGSRKEFMPGMARWLGAAET